MKKELAVVGAFSLSVLSPLTNAESVSSLKVFLEEQSPDIWMAEVRSHQTEDEAMYIISHAIEGYQSEITSVLGNYEPIIIPHGTDLFTQEVLKLKHLKEIFERIKREEGSDIDFGIIGDLPFDVDIYSAAGPYNKGEL